MTGEPRPGAGPACDVLVPTRDRPAALALTLAGLAAQDVAVRVVVADQSDPPARTDPHVASMLRVLGAAGVQVDISERRPPRGIAEQRAFLLSRARSQAILCLDDDVWLRPWAVSTMLAALDRLGCGFVGMAPVGLSFLGDVRPHQWGSFEPWQGPVEAEHVEAGSPGWRRHELHNAANPAHLEHVWGATPERWVPYRIAWIGGCVMYRTAALRSVGGFDFWTDLPVPHAGEDVLAQQRVMARSGGAGILPSGAVHLELPTTIPDREHEAWRLLGVVPQRGGRDGAGGAPDA